MLGKIEGRRRGHQRMSGWMAFWCNGHELEQTSGGGEGQRGLMCCSPWGSKELDMTWATLTREGNGTPLQDSCLENPMDRGHWRAAVHQVATSQTWLSDFTFTFMHWRRKWQPTPVFLPGESQGWQSLVGYRLWGHRVRHDWSALAAAAEQL